MCSSQRKKESIEVCSGWRNGSHTERRKHGTTMSNSRCWVERRAFSHHKLDDEALTDYIILQAIAKKKALK